MINNAKWICIPEGSDCACPEFRRHISLKGRVKKAVIYASAIGIYELRIDGKKVGGAVLAPGWTNYFDHVQYQEYDVSDMLADGAVLSVFCGKGWAGAHMGWEDTDNVYSDKIYCIYSLKIEYEDGTSEEIVSDSDVQAWTSQTLFSDIYHGETIDRTVVPHLLGNAVVGSYDTKLVPQIGEWICEHETVRPVRLITTPKGERVIDFGQNITGYVRVKIAGKRREKIAFRHAEILDKDGNFYTENMRRAKNEITYILGGGEEEFKPTFSFQGFRYICLDEYPGEVDLSCFEAVAVHSDLKRTGSFVCGHEKLNFLYSNIIWGQKDNFLDIPTDCPQRDERLGWTGDAQVFVRTAAINFDVERFFDKWLCDMRSEQRQDGGIPAVIPDCLKKCPTPTSAAWADSAAICPWEIYRAYGNESILSDNFECMRRWVEYMHAFGEEEYLWLGDEHYGDWLGLDAYEDSYVGSTDKDFIASCFFAYSTSILIRAGKIIGKAVGEYEQMHEKILAAIKERFIEDGLPTSRTQTACALLIHFGLCDSPERVAELLAELIKENGGKLTTGFVGTPYLLHALSETGHNDIAYNLLLCEEYPSWLYSVNHGATTMWEHWDGVKEDGSFWSADMNSFNHYAYGSVFDWIFSVAGGIKAAEDGAGYSKVIIEPVPDKRLGFIDLSIETRHGKIVSRWQYREDFVRYEIEIPDGVEASICLPDGQTCTVCGGQHIFFTKQ